VSTPPRAVVDHDLCAGVSQCARLAPGAFRIREDFLSVFEPTGEYTAEQLEQAAEFCPMEAITLVRAPASTEDTDPDGAA